MREKYIRPFLVNRTAVILLFFISIQFSGCQATRNANHSFLSNELAMGAKIHQKILSQFYLYTEASVNRYVREIGAKIAKVADRKELEYRFTVLYDDNIFATSAPGGHVYITTGVLNFLENESELAGVLAHEIGQLQYVEPYFRMSKKIVDVLYQVTLIAAPFFGAFGALAAIGMTGVNVAANYEKSRRSRVFAADELALRFMLDAGYDPQGLLDVVYRLSSIKETGAYRVMDYERIRPISIKRIDQLKGDFRKLPLEDTSFNVNRDAFLERVRPVREMYKS